MTTTEQEKILAAVLNDEITFSKAAKSLNVSNEELEELIDNYTPVSSFETIIKISEFEKKSISHINEVIQKHTPVRERLDIVCKFPNIAPHFRAFEHLPKTFIATFSSGSTPWEIKHTISSFRIESKGILSSYKASAIPAPSIKPHQTQEGMTFQYQEVIKPCS